MIYYVSFNGKFATSAFSYLNKELFLFLTWTLVFYKKFYIELFHYQLATLRVLVLYHCQGYGPPDIAQEKISMIETSR